MRLLAASERSGSAKRASARCPRRCDQDGCLAGSAARCGRESRPEQVGADLDVTASEPTPGRDPRCARDAAAGRLRRTRRLRGPALSQGPRRSASATGAPSGLGGGDELSERQASASKPHELELALGECPGLVEEDQRRRASRSSASPPLIKMPSRAAFPMAALTASGVARPRAQGQVTTKTAIAFWSARSGDTCHHRTAVSAARPSTARTNRPATRSASSAMGARRAAADSTLSAACPTRVACPVRSAGRILEGDIERAGMHERARADVLRAATHP